MSTNTYFCVNVCSVWEKHGGGLNFCAQFYNFFHLLKLTASLCNEQKQKHLPSVKLVFLILLLKNHGSCTALIDSFFFFISSAFYRMSYSC